MPFGQCSAKEFWSKWTMTKLGHVLYFVSMDGKRFLAGVTLKNSMFSKKSNIGRGKAILAFSGRSKYFGRP